MSILEKNNTRDLDLPNQNYLQMFPYSIAQFGQNSSLIPKSYYQKHYLNRCLMTFRFIRFPGGSRSTESKMRRIQSPELLMYKL